MTDESGGPAAAIPGEPANLYRYRFDGVEVDAARGDMRIDGAPRAIEPKPLALLLALLERPRRIAAHEELLQRLWGRQPQHLSDNVLANAVSKLRKALGPRRAASVRSVAGRGYRIDADVERVVVAWSPAATAAWRAGDPVPGRAHHRLERPLSRAHQDVWLARHVQTGSVRIFKFCAGEERLAALKREFTLFRVLRESLGDREDFARVLDANFASAPYFLECEYGGENLSEWAENGGRLAAMDLSERIALFLGIARAVADAHGVGVLHKDLKPANVLVAPAGAEAPPGRVQTRITDFGSGRLLTPERLAQIGVTQLGFTLTRSVTDDPGSGTPLYLAPELLAGRMPTVQSDLYALGVMLYQLIAGDLKKPMATGWEYDVPDPLLREDIAAATEGRPERRLPGVAALVERLSALDERRAERERRIAEASRAEAAQQAWRRARARRPWIAALGVALAAGLALSLWQWRAAEEAGARAEALQLFLRDDVLGAANPFAARRAEPMTVREAVAAAASGVERRFAGHPGTEAVVRAALARLMTQYQDLAAAEAQWSAALPLLDRALGPRHRETALARYQYAALLTRAGKTDAAEAVLAKADAAVPDDGRDAELAVMRDRIRGQWLMQRQRLAEATVLFERALGSARTDPATDPRLLDGAYADLAGANYAAGRYPQAVAVARDWRAALAARAEAPALTKALADQRLAESLVQMGRWAEAEPLLRDAVAAFAAGLGDGAMQTVLARNAMCDLHEQSGRLAAAVDCRLALHRFALGAPEVAPWFAWVTLVNAGIDMHLMGRHRDADATFEQALPALRRLDGTDGHVATLGYYQTRALLKLGRAADALERVGDISIDALLAAEPDTPWPMRLALLEGIARAQLGERAAAHALIAPWLAEAERRPEWADDTVLAMARDAAARLVR